MDSYLTKMPLYIAGIGGLFSLLIVAFVFVTKQFSKHQNKDEQDKLLLKQLLEGFGLEVPSELTQRDVPVVKSIKGN